MAIKMDILTLSFKQRRPLDIGLQGLDFNFEQTKKVSNSYLPSDAKGKSDLKTDILTVQILSLQEAAVKQTEWSDLAGRSLEPNIFYEPDFIIPATLHLVPSKQPSFVFVRNNSGQLMGVFPFTNQRFNFGSPVMRGWQDVNSALGVPLVDATRADAVLLALMDFVEQSNFKALLFLKIYENGLFFEALKRVTVLTTTKVQPLNKTRRAFLKCRDDAKSFFNNNWSAKKLKNTARLHRRLSDINTVEHKVLTSSDDIKDATERFLSLEISGWKGKTGTALLQKHGHADFTRAMMLEFASKHKVEIHELYCGETLIASGIVLQTAEKAWFWKVSHNESFENFSPGVLLVKNLTQSCLGQDTMKTIDSCAIQNHPMIDSLWTDRVSMVSCMVGTSGFALKIAVLRETLWHNLWQILRSMYIKLKRSKEN